MRGKKRPAIYCVLGERLGRTAGWCGRRSILPCQRGIHSRGTRSAVSGHGPAQHGQQTIAPPDAPDAIKAHAVAWATYREALRNVPEQEGFPVQGDLAGSSRW